MKWLLSGKDRPMFKKNLLLTLALMIMASVSLPYGVFALNYSGSQGNRATFETLEETRASSPAAVASLETNNGKAFKSHPVLDGYPKGTTYIYRSPNLFGGRAAARLNTNILVFAEKSFQSKDAALNYLKDLGLIDIINQAIGSIVLVTPSDSKTGFTANDQKFYYALQTAIFAQKANERSGNVTTYYSDAEYFGGFGYTYLVGINGGATFLNNYVAGTLDYIGRIAGMLLINGKMENIRNVAALVPVFLVNATDAIVEKYKNVNNTDASTFEGGLDIWYNQALPLKRVVVAKDANADAAKCIRDAYYNLFVKAMRVPVLKPGLHSASTPYRNNSLDQAPYSLCERNAIINGVTKNGIHLVRRTEERFRDFETQISLFLGYNGMKQMDAFDFNAYPVAGFKADRVENIKLNNEYKNTSWYINNADGVPMIALSVTEGLVHALYPEYGKIMWNFAKHYSRDQKTGAVKYNPYSK